MKLTQQTLKKMIREMIQEVEIAGQEYEAEDFGAIASRPDTDIVSDAIHTAEAALEEWLGMATRDMPEDLAAKYEMVVGRLSKSMRSIQHGEQGLYKTARSMAERKGRK